MINAFTDETNVVASAYYERVFDTSNITFVDNNTVSINGVSIEYGTSLSELVDNINNTDMDGVTTVTGAGTQIHGVTASYEGQNLILRGDGVQNVNIQNNDYTVASEAETTIPSLVTAGASRTATWVAADVKAGRTLTLSIAATSGIQALGGTAQSFSYTVTSSDTVSTVADKFYDLIVEQMLATSGGAAFTVGAHVSVTGATITFMSEASAGSATITMGVSQVGAGNLMFSAANANHYGALKLQSTDGSPVAIDFGQSARSDGELGLVEMNLGDTTYDGNAAANATEQVTTSAISGISVGTSAAAEAALLALDAALETVTQNRGDLGAIQNRLNHTVSNLSNVVENTAASRSRILTQILRSKQQRWLGHKSCNKREQRC